MIKLFHLIRHPAFKRLSGEAFWVAFGVVFSTLGTFVGVRLLTSMMSPEEYGRLALAVSVAMGFMYSFGGLCGTVTRFFPIARLDGKAVWYWQAIRRSLALVSVFTLFTIMLLAGVASVAGFGVKSLLFFGITILYSGAMMVYLLSCALHAGARNRKILSWHQCALEWGRFFFAFALIYLWQASATVVLAGFTLASLVVAFSGWFWVRKFIFSTWSRDPSSKDRTSEFFNYLWPLLIGGVFLWMQMVADRWALKTFCSLEEVGIYFALYQISYAPMLYFSGFLINFLGPIFFEKSKDVGDHKQHCATLRINERISVVMSGLIILGVVAAFWVGEPVCTVLIDRNYSSGYWAFPWILLSGGVYAIAQQLLMSVYSGMDTRVMIPLRAAAAVLSCGCYMAGAFLGGFPGVIFGGLAFSFLSLMMSASVHFMFRGITKDSGAEIPGSDGVTTFERR